MFGANRRGPVVRVLAVSAVVALSYLLVEALVAAAITPPGSRVLSEWSRTKEASRVGVRR